MTATLAQSPPPGGSAESEVTVVTRRSLHIWIWRGADDDARWARPALFALLIVTAALYLINLTSSGWANAFYSARTTPPPPPQSAR